MKLRSSACGVSSRETVGCVVEPLESRSLLSAGGGFTNAGLTGEYFASSTLTGVRAFTRDDVRIDFDWGLAAPGGSPAAPYNRVQGGRFSVRWRGQLIPRFSETYTFIVSADDGVRLAIRPVGGRSTRLVDNFQTGQGPSTHTATYKMVAGRTYDVWLDYRDRGGPAAVSLQWQSPSTPREVIDPVRSYNLGLSDINDSSVDKTFVDVWKTLRGYDKPTGGTAAPTLDAQGWPQGDFKSYLWDGSFLTGDQSGTYHLSFKGQADVTFANAAIGKTTFTGYDAAANTSTYDVVIVGTANTTPQLNFANTRLTADAATNTGVTGVQLLRPGYTAANTFTTPLKRLAEKFPILRFMSWTSTVNNHVENWADRTLPGDSQIRRFGGKAAGVAWEYVVQFANETGRDVWINFPGGATDDYVTKLAQLLKYGSDAAGNAYTSVQSDPVHPPLNPNLRIYLEYSNEVWSNAVYQHQQNLTVAKAEVAAGNSPLNYDGVTDENVWGRRRYAERIVQADGIFRSVFGDAAMNQVRPVLMWQYDNQNNSASDPLEFLHNYYGNGDQQQHVADPHPVGYYVFGAGQASYYKSNNSGADTVDGIFAAGIPDTSYIKRLKISAAWAQTYGLQLMTYEGGLSLDTSTNYTMNETQIAARLDPRTKDAVIDADRIFRELGGFSSAYYGSGAKRTVPFARTDNIENIDNPQIQAIDEMNRTLPAERTFGRAIPDDIAGGEFDTRSPSWLRTTIGGTADVGVTPSGNADRAGVVIYDIYVGTPGTYAISFNTKAATADGRLQLFMDNQAFGDVLALPTVGDSDARTIALTAGYHSLRLAWRAGFFTINQVKVHNVAAAAVVSRRLWSDTPVPRSRLAAELFDGEVA